MIRCQLRKAAILLANGYILFFFSERVFWSFWRPGDNLPEFLITWIAYCLLGWIFLDLVRRFKVASFPPLFLCGAVFGWVDEGVVVDTLYGNSTNPFPLSISFTGLAWHALLSIGVGWYLIGKALTEEKPTRTALISLAVGIGWGLWAVWWPTELGKEADTSVWGFASHALPCSMLFLLAWFVFGLARPDWFQSSRLATIVLWGLVVAIFLAARVPARPYAALILPPLLTRLLRRLAPKRTHGAAPRCPRWDLGTHSTSQRDRPSSSFRSPPSPFTPCSAASNCTCRPTWCST